jgi:required for meiotic nuclear division protein 1
MIQIVAYQPAENINIKRLRGDYTGELISGSVFDLFYRYKGGYIYVLSYGVVVFGNIEEIDRTNFMHLVKNYSENMLETRYQEDFVITKSQGASPEFTYSALAVPMINDDLVRIVMLQVAQSIALDFYQERSQLLLNETTKYTTQLEKYGKLQVPKKELLKFVGRTLNMKSRIIDDLYVLDAPPSVWENELLGKVHDGLSKTFDIPTRFRDVEYTLRSVEGSLQMFMDLINTEQSHRLEWIIIGLILFEVVHVLVQQFFFSD